MLSRQQIDQCEIGLEKLRLPILPLVRLIGMLYLASPHDSIELVLNDLEGQVETGGLIYENPATLLRPFLQAMLPFERLKRHQAPSRIILNEHLEPVDPFEALDGWVSQNVLDQELESINSLLCGPCKCTLCCIGPDDSLQQLFFEIPLQDNEITLFHLQHIKSSQSQNTTSQDNPTFKVDNTLFYDKEITLYHWRNGWSMILPRNSHCPNLEIKTGGCCIYPNRPEVCRKPQIFAYALERNEENDREVEGRMLPAFLLQGKILAVWDCPYVKQFKDEISRYAEMCGLEPVFMENKT